MYDQSNQFSGQPSQSGVSAKIKLSFQEGTFEISGTETFVQGQVMLFADSIRKVLDGFTIIDQSTLLESDLDVDTNLTLAESTPIEEIEEVLEEVEIPNYDNVFILDDQKVQLTLKKVPGNNQSKKAINLTLVYLLAKTWVGIDEVTMTETRDAVKKYLKVDAKSFSNALKTAKDMVIISKQNLLLSDIGREQAQSLISDLIS